MRLVTYQRNHEARLGALVDRQVIDIQQAYRARSQAQGTPASLVAHFTSMLTLLAAGGEAMGAAADSLCFATSAFFNAGDALPGTVLDLEEVTLQAPLRNPGKLICIGGNFPAAGKLSAPDHPIIFLKPASTITGHNMPVPISRIASNVGYEVELALVIGKRAHNLAAQDASKHIAGYTLANDMGDRLLEKRTSQWTSGKMFDAFTPLGPAILTPDEIADTHKLQMRTWVNGQQVQSGNTCEMFFDCENLVCYLSTLTTLAPGDIILTGSPKLINAAPAPSLSLKPGDTVKVAIDGLGELTNPLEAEPE